MVHETIEVGQQVCPSAALGNQKWTKPYFVIRSNMLRGSRMKVGKTTLLRSAPGLSWEMICDKTDDKVSNSGRDGGRLSG